MKKKLLFFILLLSILCLNVTIVQAAEEKMTIKPSTNMLKQGEIFTVTLHAESSDGINMITANYNYDKEKLNLINYSVPDGYTDWSGEGVDELVIMITNGEIITSVDCILTFEVKNDVPDNTQTNIKFEQVGIDTFANSNHRFNFDDTEISIQIGDIQQRTSLYIIIIAIIAVIIIAVLMSVVIIRKKKK